MPSPITLAHDRTVRRLVDTGRLGDVLAIDVRGMPGTFVDRDAAITWRQDRGLSGLNTLAVGIWYEALARWVGHAVQVMAMSRIFVPERWNEAGQKVTVEVPDHVDVLATMECGAQASMRFSDVTGQAVSPWSVWIYGSEATLVLDAKRDELHIAGRNHRTFERVTPPPEERGAWRVEEEFVGAIRGEEEVVLTPFAEGVRYMEFTEAVAHSAQTGQRVDLPLSVVVGEP